jgi:GT2 family glycosyltransferase
VAAVKGAYKTQQRELVARFAQAEFEARYQKLATARFIDVVFSYAAAFRREVFWEVEGFDTWFPVADNEDTELSYRLAAAGRRIVFNPRAIVYHRHPRTLRQYLTKKFSRAYWRAFVYRRFPGKAVRDSYTPQSLKLQIGLIYLLTLTTALTVLTRVGLYLAAATLGVFFVTTLPFLWRLPREERHLQVTAPFFLLCRAVVMAAGLLSVLPRLIKKEEQIDERLR